MSNHSIHNDELKKQIIRALRPIDDALMRLMLQDNIPLVELILRIILDKDDLIVTDIETQRDLNKLAGGRSICLDAYATDSENKKYDIEIQRSDHGADAHRARYHLGVLDTENLKAGQDFKDLPDTYIIFITENDYFGKGEPLYIFEKINTKTHEPINDGAYTIYVNGQYRGDNDIGKLMHDFCCAVPEEMYFSEMSERAKQFKEYKKEDNKMNAAVERIIAEHLERDPNPTDGILGQLKERWINKAKAEGIAEGIAEGKAEGIAQGKAEGKAEGIAQGKAEGIAVGKAEGRAEEKRQTARKMLAAGTFTLEQIAEFSGLNAVEIEKLREETNR